MDPITIYISLFFLAVVMCVAATAFTRKPSRACLSCGRESPIEGRRCRHCGYQPGRV
jgi:ribosomal protein L40E